MNPVTAASQGIAAMTLRPVEPQSKVSLPPKPTDLPPPPPLLGKIEKEAMEYKVVSELLKRTITNLGQHPIAATLAAFQNKSIAFYSLYCLYTLFEGFQKSSIMTHKLYIILFVIAENPDTACKDQLYTKFNETWPILEKELPADHDKELLRLIKILMRGWLIHNAPLSSVLDHRNEVTNPRSSALEIWETEFKRFRAAFDAQISNEYEKQVLQVITSLGGFEKPLPPFRIIDAINYIFWSKFIVPANINSGKSIKLCFAIIFLLKKIFDMSVPKRPIEMIITDYSIIAEAIDAQLNELRIMIPYDLHPEFDHFRQVFKSLQVFDCYIPNVYKVYPPKEPMEKNWDGILIYFFIIFNWTHRGLNDQLKKINKLCDNLIEEIRSAKLAFEKITSLLPENDKKEVFPQSLKTFYDELLIDFKKILGLQIIIDNRFNKLESVLARLALRFYEIKEINLTSQILFKQILEDILNFDVMKEVYDIASTLQGICIKAYPFFELVSKYTIYESIDKNKSTFKAIKSEEWTAFKKHMQSIKLIPSIDVKTLPEKIGELYQELTHFAFFGDSFLGVHLLITQSLAGVDQHIDEVLGIKKATPLMGAFAWDEELEDQEIEPKASKKQKTKLFSKLNLIRVKKNEKQTKIVPKLMRNEIIKPLVRNCTSLRLDEYLAKVSAGSEKLKRNKAEFQVFEAMTACFHTIDWCLQHSLQMYLRGNNFETNALKEHALITYAQGRDHLYLTFSNFEELSRAVLGQDVAAIAMVMPKLVQNLYFCQEQFESTLFLMREQEKPQTHAIVDLLKSERWEHLEKSQQEYFKSIDYALYWARSPYVMKKAYQEIGKPIPPLLTTLVDSQLLLEECFISKKVLITPAHVACLEAILESLCEHTSKAFDNLNSLVKYFSNEPEVIARTETFCAQLKDYLQNFRIWSKTQIAQWEKKEVLNAECTFQNLNQITSSLVQQYADEKEPLKKDGYTHFLGIIKSLQLFERNSGHLSAARLSSLLNIQWVLEKGFRSQFYALKNRIIWVHDFQKFSEYMAKEMPGLRPSEEIKAASGYNYKKGVHYFRKEGELTRDPSLLKLTALINLNINLLGSNNGFIPAGKSENLQSTLKTTSQEFIELLLPGILLSASVLKKV